ncbi:MAG: DUF4256 domain-containing protein [Saprospiraceae bacterium]|nr:DUF4256 domain-containing protein [Saprospiraceae bacterium]
MKNKLSHLEKVEILNLLESRFINNTSRHKEIEWKFIKNKFELLPEKLFIIYEMEKTGGEPDLIVFQNNEIAFVDCSKESPSGRRSVCYDHEALLSRKEYKPKQSALGMAYDMGIEILTESQYRELQCFGEFDLKSSSWIKTPQTIRDLGGAVFCDRRYNTVFTYHNGAESYYASRGFRGCLFI